MRYKAVCFDIDGTLYPARVMRRKLFFASLAHPIDYLRYRKMRLTIRENQEESSESFRAKEAKLMYGGANFRGRELSTQIMIQRLEDHVYSKMEKQYKTLKAFDGVRETFQREKARGAKIGILSDFPLFEKLKAMGLDAFVDAALCAEDTGFLKPCSRCFEIMLYNLGVDPSEALYVGDSYSKDVEGAKGAGLDAVLVNRKKGNYPQAFGSWKEFDLWLKEVQGE